MKVTIDIDNASQLERELWGQGRENFNEFSREEQKELFDFLEEYYDDVPDLVAINDWFWHEPESLCELAGVKDPWDDDFDEDDFDEEL